MPPSAVNFLFLNPWDRVIGPNRYLVEMLRHRRGLAAESLVVFDRAHDGAEELRALGCRVEIWPEVALIRPGLGIIHWLALAQHHSFGGLRFARRLRRLRPRLLVSNTENLWLGGFGSRLLGIPHVQIFHALTVFERLGRRPRALRAYLRFLAGGCQRLIAVSETQAAALERGGVAKEQVTVVPNPIAIEALQQAAQEPLGVRSAAALQSVDGPVLVSAGRICTLKGQDLLVEALASVRERFPTLHCLFAGRFGAGEGAGAAEQRFQQRLLDRIQTLGLGEQVTFLGEIDDLPALLRRADLYVQPSRSESFGRVVAEALACGTPVAAFDVGAVGEVMGPGGRLARPEDPADLADTISMLLGDPAASQLVEAGAEHLSHFAAPGVAERFETILRSILGSGIG